MTTTSAKVITLTIDGREVGAREDQTILTIARENKIHIPTLCFLEGLSPAGACRLCLVEIVGTNRILPACTTYATDGMVVRTTSESLEQHRRTVIELLFAEGNHVCAVCVSNGNCELQDLATELGVDHITLPYLNPKRPVDASHPRFTLDHNRCVLCARCVRVCDEIEGAHTWDIMGRGVDARIIADLNQPWGEAVSCTSCGKCVHVCPTGALVEKGKAVAEMKKRHAIPKLITRNKEPAS
ncbi:MAG TPA: bidirectional hydrogenase complex protein HoxU [Kiritimatiellia bacterium]|nr:bidirectional hydrogenase complex protein HoxU [Kiritimatiellia bacterium]